MPMDQYRGNSGMIMSVGIGTIDMKNNPLNNPQKPWIPIRSFNHSD